MDYDSDSDGEFEMCSRNGGCCSRGGGACSRGGGCSNASTAALPFDPTSLENLILAISDKFDFRVVLNEERTRGALLVTTGLTIAGGLIGRHYGGKVGAAVGGAIGGACGLGIVVVSMRQVWDDIKAKLSELFDIVYDYLAGMGIEDYQKAASFITEGNDSTQLAMMVLETTTTLIGKKVLSSIAASSFN